MKIFFKKYTIHIYICLFLIISYISIYKTSIYLSYEKIYYKQLIWYTLGIIFIYIIKRINLKKLLSYSKYLYIINIILLLGLFFFGSEINNSKAWYSFGIISFQPCEFMKISIILFDSYIIDKYKRKKKDIELLLILFLTFLIPSILAFLEPDTGSVISYLVITLSFIYISNINQNYFKTILVVGIGLLILFFISYFLFQDYFISILGTSLFYRIDRLINWNMGKGLQLNNSLIVIGSSGIFGHSSIPLYYPELETDFIFTSFTSIYGIIGGILLIVLALSFDLYLLKIMKKTSNIIYKYIVFSIAILFLFQHIQSIGMSLGLLPIIGITFPLISYGGSSLISYLILLGIVINIKEKV